MTQEKTEKKHSYKERAILRWQGTTLTLARRLIRHATASAPPSRDKRGRRPSQLRKSTVLKKGERRLYLGGKRYGPLRIHDERLEARNLSCLYGRDGVVGGRCLLQPKGVSSAHGKELGERKKEKTPTEESAVSPFGASRGGYTRSDPTKGGDVLAATVRKEGKDRTARRWVPHLCWKAPRSFEEGRSPRCFGPANAARHRRSAEGEGKKASLSCAKQVGGSGLKFRTLTNWRAQPVGTIRR